MFSWVLVGGSASAVVYNYPDQYSFISNASTDTASDPVFVNFVEALGFDASSLTQWYKVESPYNQGSVTGASNWTIPSVTVSGTPLDDLKAGSIQITHDNTPSLVELMPDAPAKLYFMAWKTGAGVRYSYYEDGLVNGDVVNFDVACPSGSIPANYVSAPGGFTGLPNLCMGRQALSHFSFWSAAPEIPVPAALPLMLTGLAMLGLVTRRRRKVSGRS